MLQLSDDQMATLFGLLANLEETFAVQMSDTRKCRYMDILLNHAHATFERLVTTLKMAEWQCHQFPVPADLIDLLTTIRR